MLYDDFGKFTAQGEMWHDWMNHSGIERYTVEQFKEQFELLGENFGKPLDSIKKANFICKLSFAGSLTINFSDLAIEWKVITGLMIR